MHARCDVVNSYAENKDCATLIRGQLGRQMCHLWVFTLWLQGTFR